MRLAMKINVKNEKQADLKKKFNLNLPKSGIKSLITG